MIRAFSSVHANPDVRDLQRYDLVGIAVNGLVELWPIPPRAFRWFSHCCSPLALASTARAASQNPVCAIVHRVPMVLGTGAVFARVLGGVGHQERTGIHLWRRRNEPLALASNGALPVLDE